MVKISTNPPANFKYVNKLDEVILYAGPIAKDEDKAAILADFIKKLRNNQRIVLAINNSEELNAVLKSKDILTQDRKDIFILSKEIYLNDSEERKMLKEVGLPIFFSTIITTWESFYEMADLAPSDIYIGGDLFFEIKYVAKVAHDRNINIRIFPNLNTALYKREGLNVPFVTPESLEQYNGYVDYAEIWCDVDNKNYLNAVFPYYYFRNKWFGELKEVIAGLEAPFDGSHMMHDDFPKQRLDCRRSCCKGGNCKICDSLCQKNALLKKAELFFN